LEGAYPLLSQLSRTLVFAVAEEFDHAAFVGRESGRTRSVASVAQQSNKDNHVRNASGKCL
jgi:hypothetical protein